jgi:RNA polymerase sigma-70 factor (sigma-E family)
MDESLGSVESAMPDGSAGVSEGEGEGFDAFYSSRWLSSVHLAHAILGSAAVAEEVAQEAFIRTHDRWSSLITPDAFLRTALVNLCRSQLRRRRLERLHHDARDVALPASDLDETWLAIGCLPYRQRAVLALRYYADLPEREIAILLGCRLGTVKSAHSRALARLREELS